MISDKLYDLAFKFKKTKLWDILWKNLFFAVKLSDNRIGYIRLIREKHYALELYIGEEGLESLRTMIKADKYQLEVFEYQELPLRQYCLQCALVGKEALSEEEKEEAKAFARSHGIKLAGKNAYPQFTKFQPYCYPWYLQTEKEQETLCEALAAAIEMSKLLERKTLQQLGLKEVSGNTDEIILLERREDVYVFGKMELPAEKEEKWPVPEMGNDISIAKVKKIKRSGVWECGFIRILEPVVEEEGQIPVYPIILFVIDSATGYILPLPLVAHYEDNPDELMNFFMETLLEENICPGKILVKDSRTYAFFMPFCKKLKIAIKQEEYLPALENAENAFYSTFGMDSEVESEEKFDWSDSEKGRKNSELDGGTIQEIERLLDIFLERNKGQRYQLPEDIVDQFTAFLKNGNIPKSLKDKLSYLLDSVNTDGRQVESTIFNSKEEPKLESVSSKMAKAAEGKSYVISVSLGAGCYRHIQISCNAFLSELHSVIIDAFEFDNDHAHAFFMDNKIWSDWDCYYAEEVADNFKSTSRYRLSQTGLYKGMKFKYLFDFGDEWNFQCKVLRVIEKVTEKPIVIKAKGEAPEQYPNWDDDWGDDWNDE